jgi:hypothetical protein
MLTQLLELVASHPRGLGVRELSRRLHTQPGAIEGMLELLVRKGRLVKLCASATVCADCPVHSDCNLLAGHNTRYVVAPRSPSPTCATTAPSLRGVVLPY